MNITKNAAMKKAVTELWKHYLLSIASGDIMLGEVADQLYISDLDFSCLKRLGKKRAIMDLVTTGFSGTIDDAVDNLYYEYDDMKPYSYLMDFMSPEDAWDAMFRYIAAHTEYYDASLITKNPYYTHVKAPTAQKGNIKLTTTDYLAGEFFQTYHKKYTRTDPFGYANIGFFDGKVKFPVLLENGKVWMSVVISEIESMEKPIELAHGKVITYGLGLGYYAFMAAEKPEVESVTVVEMNPKVISLFEKHLLPQFPHKEKIHIVEADKKTRHEYWIETCFLEYYFRPVIMKVLLKKVLGKDIKLPKVGEEETKASKAFEAFLETWNVSIDSVEKLYYVLGNKTLIPLMRRFACAYQKTEEK